MKIGIVSNMYPSDDDGKYGIFVKGLTDSLLKKGIEVPFMCVIKGREHNKFKKLLKYIRLYSCTIYNLLFKKSDAVYFHYPLHLAPLLYFLSFFMIKPFVLNFHGSDLTPDSRVLRFFDILLKKSVRSARLLVVPSEYFKKKVIEKFSINADSVFISPSGGVDFTLFRMTDDNPASLKEYTAGYISRISVAKGWKVYLDALKMLKDKGLIDTQKFLIAGSGPDEDIAEKTIADFGLNENIVFIKTGDQNRFPLFFNSIDVLIFPSYKESLGLVGLEAMACGTPVIGSKMGGISQYLIDGENGLFFETGKADDLAIKIEKWIGFSKVEKMRFRENALNTAKDYDRERITVLLYKKLQSVIDVQEL